MESGGLFLEIAKCYPEDVIQNIDKSINLEITE